MNPTRKKYMLFLPKLYPFRVCFIKHALHVLSDSFFYQILRQLQVNSTMLFIAEKDIRSPSFHYEWHLQYTLIFIYKKRKCFYKVNCFIYKKTQT